MIRISLRGLLTRKLRATLTGIAVVLGVAMVCGTFVLTDTINAAFHSITSDSRKYVSAVVTAKKTINRSTQTPTVSESLMTQIQTLNGVKKVTGQVAVINAPIIGHDGKPISTGGAPALGMGFSSFETRVGDPTKIAAGHWPTKANEVMIDAHSAKTQHLKIGDWVKVAYSGPAQRYRLSGYATYGSSDSAIGGATFAIFNLPTAQKLFGLQGRLTEIDVEAKANVAPASIVSEVKPLLTSTDVVRTAQQQIKEDQKQWAFFVNFLRYLLLAFGLIAVFVGAFVIFNTLSITVAQRTRELATLRTLGASGRQVLGGVMTEGLTIGIIASIVGLGFGILVAKGLNAMFQVMGANIPHTGTILAQRTIVLGLAVGIGTTLIASLMPAIRATRVPPIAAVREGAILPKRPHPRWRFAFGIVLLVDALLAVSAAFAAKSAFGRTEAAVGGVMFLILGVGVLKRPQLHVRSVFATLLIYGSLSMLLSGLFSGGVGVAQRLVTLGVGCLTLFLGVALIASYVVRPLARVASPIGAVVTTLVSVIIWLPITLPYWLLRYAAFTSGKGKVGRRVLALVVGFGIPCGPVLVLIVLVMKIHQALTGWSPDWPIEIFNPITALRALWPGSKAGRVDQVSLRLGTHNARRNPQRTAATSAALMIGIALVTFVTVLVGGFTKSTEAAVNENVTANYVVASSNGQSSLGNAITPALKKVKEVTDAVAIQIDYGKVGNTTATVAGIDPLQIASVWRLRWKQGSNASLNQLHGNNAFLLDTFAKDKKLKVGEDFTLLAPSGRKLRLHVAAIDKQSQYLMALGQVTLSSAEFSRVVSITPQTTAAVLVRTVGGATDANKMALEKGIADFPTAKVMTKQQYIDLVNQGFTQIQTMFWILLGLAVLISVLGIINTLALAVYERTRELGMLRAIGLTRMQTRRMIRHESASISLIGAALGMPLGILLAALVIAALSKYGVVFSLPWPLLIVFVIVTVVFGMIAAIFPASRAAKLNVLEALQYE